MIEIQRKIYIKYFLVNLQVNAPQRTTDLFLIDKVFLIINFKLL